MANKLEKRVYLLNDTSYDQHHGCSAVLLTIIDQLNLNSMKICGSLPSRADLSQFKTCIQAIMQADLVIVNGEGTLHDDMPAANNLLEMCRIVKEMNIPIYLINASWFNNSNFLLRKLVCFDGIYLRDSESLECVQLQYPNAKYAPDLTFMTPFEGNSFAREGVLVTDNVDRKKIPALLNLMSDLSAKPVSIHKKTTKGLMQFCRDGISLRADLFSPSFLFDLIYFRYLLYRVNVSRVEEFMLSLSKAQLLISGRFHACTFSLITETPFLAQPSNTRKIEVLCKDVGLDSWRSDLNTELCDSKDISVYGWSDQELLNIRSFVCSARLSIGQMFRDIRNSLED